MVGFGSDVAPVPLPRLDVQQPSSHRFTVTSPPVASASVSLALGNVLASLFAPQSGVAPTVPAEAAAALLAGAVWRQRGSRGGESQVVGRSGCGGGDHADDGDRRGREG